MKGKIINPTSKSDEKLNKNSEFHDLAQILGLSSKIKTLEDARKTLRYGKITIMSDQDLDGIHIKGLLLNLIY